MIFWYNKKTAINKFEKLHKDMYELWNWIASTNPIDLDINRFRPLNDGIDISAYRVLHRNKFFSKDLDVLASLNSEYDETYLAMIDLFKAENNEKIKKTEKYETFKKIYNELLEEINIIRDGQHSNENKNFTTQNYAILLIAFTRLDA